MASVAASRDSVASVPVRTNVLPLSGPGVPAAVSGASIFRPACRKLVDERPVLRLVEIVVHRGRHHGADVRHGLQLLLRRGEQGVHRSERAGERLRAALADVTDAQAEDQPPELARLAALDLVDEIRGRLLPHPLDLLEPLLRQPVDVGVARNRGRRQ